MPRMETNTARIDKNIEHIKATVDDVSDKISNLIETVMGCEEKVEDLEGTVAGLMSRMQPEQKLRNEVNLLGDMEERQQRSRY